MIMAGECKGNFAQQWIKGKSTISQNSPIGELLLSTKRYLKLPALKGKVIAG